MKTIHLPRGSWVEFIKSLLFRDFPGCLWKSQVVDEESAQNIQALTGLQKSLKSGYSQALISRIKSGMRSSELSVGLDRDYSATAGVEEVRISAPLGKI